MNTAKIYRDSEDNECSIYQMVRVEPDWAANRIQAGEKALELIKAIKQWDIEQFVKTGGYTLPPELREQIQGMSE